MRILGIDPGTAIVGWGIIEVIRGEARVVAFGHITTKKTLPMAERLQEIRTDLTKIIELHHPEEAAVEELFFFKNEKTVITVAQARGVILLTLADFGLRLSSYTPLQVKQALTNYGRADKGQIQHMVKTILRLESIPRPDDAADALALSLCHMQRRKMEFTRGIL